MGEKSMNKKLAMSIIIIIIVVAILIFLSTQGFFGSIASGVDTAVGHGGGSL
jgi:cell shape-determining protein MreC